MSTGLNANKLEPICVTEERVTFAAENNLSHHITTDELIISHVDPIIKKVIIQRFRLYFNTHQNITLSPEVEDIYQTIVMRLYGNNWVRTVLLPKHDIDEVKKYAATIAHNVCNDFFRAKYPERNRLKDKLRDLLKRHPDFAHWKMGDQTLCGFAKWKGNRQSNKVEELICEIDGKGSIAAIDGLDLTEIAGGRLSKLIADLFNWCRGPVDMENLVFIVATLQGVKDHPVESLECDGLFIQRTVDSSGQRYEGIEVRELLIGLWKGVSELPHDQRKAFMYTSADQAGESLLHRMLRERVVVVSQIYTTLDTSREELISIWGSLPMDMATAAMRLGTTNRMIAKWRHRAIKKLAASLGIEKK